MASGSFATPSPLLTRSDAARPAAFRTGFSRHLASIGLIAFAYTSRDLGSTTAPEQGEGAQMKATDEGRRAFDVATPLLPAPESSQAKGAG